MIRMDTISRFNTVDDYEWRFVSDGEAEEEKYHLNVFFEEGRLDIRIV
mgnify:CR=1 FL=1